MLLRLDHDPIAHKNLLLARLGLLRCKPSPVHCQSPAVDLEVGLALPKEEEERCPVGLIRLARL